MARNKRKRAQHERAKAGGVAVTPSAGAAAAAAPRAPGERRPPKRSRPWLWASAAAVVVLIGGLALHLLSNKPPDGAAAAATFVGSTTCAECHRPQADLWRPSQHNLAMQHASAATVLGNFNDASFDYAGVHSRFFRKDGKFFVETDGADGKLAVFEVKYTFGLDPLQQYLVEFPDGRVQALLIAWDSRSANKGGQRWFHLYPNERIQHDDILHWTKLNQNWNFMCAECHSMGVHKNYDAASNRFATTWAEISVGCEACHGQGSRHVGWARERQQGWHFGKTSEPDMGLLARFTERHDVAWSPNAATGNAVRSRAPQTMRSEVETCGLCHGRRSQLSEGWVPGHSLSDTHQVSPLTRGLYQPDGQMLDEVYNYGSFKQSKMFAAGVTCSDCHDPHSTKLRTGSIDGVCLQCHASDKYAAAAHHRHERADPKLTCASCHMPSRTYMVIDPRHDHGFRVPRPDLSRKLNTANACNDCHTDKSADWAATAVERWHGPTRKGFQSYAEGFHAAWNGGADAARLLGAIAQDRNTPAIARASALAELAPYLSAANIELARAGLADPDPMVRIGALDMLEGAPPNQLWPPVSPLLSDPVRTVRIRAASLLAAVPAANQPSADRERFERAAGEFVAAQRLNADRPEARTTLGSFLARSGRAEEAQVEYEAALQLSPAFAPAAVNLADLYRQLGRDTEGEAVLRAALTHSPRDAGMHHALGLALTRLKQTDAALAELRRATELEPDRARYAYVYAVGLHSSGRRGEALALLKKNLAKHPNDRDTLMALISFSRDAGDASNALAYAMQLEQLSPDPQLTRLIEDLQQRAAKPGASSSGR